MPASWVNRPLLTVENVEHVLNYRMGRRVASSVRDRVRWLLNHPGLWDELDEPTDSVDPRVMRLINESRKANLYAKTCYWKDVRHSLVNHLAIARACRRLGITP
jgi:hypothetical protein